MPGRDTSIANSPVVTRSQSCRQDSDQHTPAISTHQHLIKQSVIEEIVAFSQAKRSAMSKKHMALQLAEPQQENGVGSSSVLQPARYILELPAELRKLIYGYYLPKKPSSTILGQNQLLPPLAHTNKQLRQELLSVIDLRHYVRLSNVLSYTSAFTAVYEYAVFVTITINIDVGDGPGSISVDIAPLLHLRLKYSKMKITFTWFSSAFLGYLDERMALEQQCQTLGNIFVASEEPTVYQTMWLECFANSVEALFVDANVEERWDRKWDLWTLRARVVVKKTSIKQQTTSYEIGDEDAERWATENGYPIDLLSITKIHTLETSKDKRVLVDEEADEAYKKQRV